jgi:nitrogen fixation protein NifU and related proteins
MTSDATESLYQERILEHFRRPHGKGALPAPDAVATAHNPLCGEDVTVMVSFDPSASDRRVRDVRFSSDGCSITQASASMMTDLVRGRTPAEIDLLKAQLRALATGDPAAVGEETVGPLVAMRALARVPARVACAMLAWDALTKAVTTGEP